MSSTFASSLSASAVSHENTRRLVPGLLRRTSIMKLMEPGELTIGRDTDTWGVELLDMPRGYDMDDLPVPLFSRRLGTVNNGSETIIQNQLVTRQLGMFGRHFLLDRGTKQIKGGKIGDDLMRKLQEAASLDLLAQICHTMDGIDAVTGNNVYVGADTADSDVSNELSMDSLKEAFYVLDDANWQMFDRIRDVNNNFSVKEISEAYFLVIHPECVVGFLDNILSSEYVHASEYAPDSPDEVCWLKKANIRVIKSPVVRKVAGGVSTPGMRQNGPVNQVYHNFLIASGAMAFPSLGKKLMMEVKTKAGKQDAVPVFQGINVNTFDAMPSYSDPHGLFAGGTIDWWCGDTESGEGGLLLPRYSQGTASYGVVKIHTTARQY